MVGIWLMATLLRLTIYLGSLLVSIGTAFINMVLWIFSPVLDYLLDPTNLKGR